MEGSAVQDTTEVLFSRGLLIGMYERKERFSDEGVCLFFEVTGQDGVKINKLQVCG